jgi:ELWxxDGT repeat protein
MARSDSTSPLPRQGLWTLAGILLLAAAGLAQTPALLRDLNLEPAAQPSSWPDGFDVVGSRAYFLASTRATGRELFRTDGTRAGTALVVDLHPGPESGDYLGRVVGWGGGAVFAARHFALGPQLWFDDGSGASPRPLLEVAAATGHRDLGALIPLGDDLLFVADTAAYGHEWWITDGTGPGTRLVADIHPGPWDARPIEVQRLGHGVFFVADRSGTGREPWFTDGTAAGTVLLADVIPGGGSSNARFLARVGSRLLFHHEVGIPVVPPLWVTDGTPTGTAGIASGLRVEPWSPALSLGAGALFVGSDASHGRELWFSDGTAAGTRLVVDLTPGPASSEIGPIGLLPGGRVLLRVGDAGRQGLWSTDGSAAGTQRISTVLPWGSPGVELRGAVLFRGSDGQSGQELWRSDGSTAGTSLLRDTLPGAGDAAPDLLARLGQEVLFVPLALHTASAASLGGVEPWISDGSAAGTRLLADVHALPPGATAGSHPVGGVDWNGRAAFVAAVGPGAPGRSELFVSAGSAGSTGLHFVFPGDDPLRGLNERGDPRLHPVAGRLLVIADDPGGLHRLWLDSGRGPVPGPAVELIPDWRAPLDHAVIGDAVWLGGSSLWQVRGLSLNRAPLPVGFQYPIGLTRVGEALLFLEFAGHELWRCDPDLRCTRLVAALPCGACWIGTPIAARDRAFFAQWDQAHGLEIRVTDGTPAGTRVLDLVPGPQHLAPRPLAALGRGCLLQFDEGSVAGQLAWTDGTVGGTVLLPVFPAGLVPGRIDALLPVGPERFAFVMDDGVHGREPWLLDRSGARLVADLLPGTQGSDPRLLGAAGREFYVMARTPAPGLWRSDGTAAGTAALVSVIDGPHLFVLSGGRIYFDREDPAHGVEPWVVSAGATAQSVGSGCGVGLRTPWMEADDPVLGRTLELRGGGGAAGSLGIVALGVPLGLPRIHGGGCVEWVDLTGAAVLLQIADAAADWSFGLGLPAEPGLVGVALMAQLWCGPSPRPQGFEASAGLRLDLGAW